MTHHGHDRVLDLRPIFGVEARVTAPSEATGGEYVETECTAEPGSGTMVHYHPEQEETFRVLEGKMEVLREGLWSVIEAGESLAIPGGIVHAWRNASDAPVRFLNVHRPARGFRFEVVDMDGRRVDKVLVGRALSSIDAG